MIIFLTLQDVLRIYAISMSRFGGMEGVRDKNLLLSALAQVQILHCYEQPDMSYLGAAYAYFIIKNHPFLDGNKRMGLLSALLFFEKNNILIHCSHEDLYTLILGMADSTYTLKNAADFFEDHIMNKN